MVRKNAVGAVLIMTMMAVCLTFMMLFALIQTSGIGLHNSSDFYNREAALMAAQSGLDYAVTHLRSKSDWRGNSEKRYYGSWGSDLCVEEDNGNVVGVITHHDGAKSAFRIKFNYETNDEDTYKNAVLNRFGAFKAQSQPKYKIASPYVCVNNLTGRTSVLVYRASANGEKISAEADYSELVKSDTDNANNYVFHLAPQSIYMVIEGLSGGVINSCKSLNDVNNAANNNKFEARRYVEVCLSCVETVTYNSEAAYAKNDIVFDVANKMFVKTNVVDGESVFNADDDLHTVPDPGCLRSSEANIAINRGVLNTFNGKILRKDNASVSFKPDLDPYTFKNSKGEPEEYTFPITAVENCNDRVNKIEWKNLVKATKKDGELTAGFYQWHTAAGHTANSPKYELRWYPGGYDLDNKGRPVPKRAAEYKIAVNYPVDKNDGSKKYIGPAKKIAFVKDGSGNIIEPQLSLSGHLYCSGDFVISSDVTEVANKCPSVLLASYYYSRDKKNYTEDGMLTADGNVFVASCLYGSGSIASQKDVTFMGTSAIESGKSGVAIYGKNVNFKSLELAMAKSPDGTSMAASVDHSNGSKFNLNDDGSRDIVPTDGLYDFLHESWVANNKDPKTPRVEDVESYFKKLGVKTDVCHASSADVYIDGRKVRLYSARFSIENTCGKSYVVFADSDGNVSMYNGKLRPGGCWIDEDGDPIRFMHIPACGVLPLASDSIVPEDIQERINEHGSICYGDQNFNGVVYAQESVTADLTDQFTLNINGMLCAADGDITVTCKGATLSYDENCINKLLAPTGALNFKFWNCW